MQWAISNIFGSVGWIAGLTCLKGGLPPNAIAFAGQGQTTMGALLCLGGAGVLLWSNLGAQS